MNRLRQIINTNLFRNVGIYTFGHILNAAIPFLLMPVLTRYLSPEDYGITAMLAVLLGLYSPFVGLNLPGYVSVAFFKNRVELPLVVSTVVALLVISLVVAIIVTLFGGVTIAELSQFPVDWLWGVLFLCFANFFITILQNIQQAKENAKQYSIIQLGQTTVNLLLSLFFVVVLTMNWQGRIWAQVITDAFFMLVAILIMYRWGLLKCQFSLSYMRSSLSFGVPLIPHALCGAFVLAADRFFISNMIGLGEVGIFSVGFSLGQVIELLGTSFNKAFCPWLYGKLKDFDDGKSNDEYKIVKFTYACMAGFIILAIGYSLFMPWFLSFFVGPKFQDASKYILSFALAAAINAIYYLVVNYIFYRQKTQYLAMITFGSGVLHIVITYFMIKTWGAIGAAYAAVITHSIMTIMTWWLSNKVYPMPWLLWKKNS